MRESCVGGVRVLGCERVGVQNKKESALVTKPRACLATVNLIKNNSNEYFQGVCVRVLPPANYET